MHQAYDGTLNAGLTTNCCEFFKILFSNCRSYKTNAS